MTSPQIFHSVCGAYTIYHRPTVYVFRNPFITGLRYPLTAWRILCHILAVSLQRDFFNSTAGQRLWSRQYLYTCIFLFGSSVQLLLSHVHVHLPLILSPTEEMHLPDLCNLLTCMAVEYTDDICAVICVYPSVTRIPFIFKD